MEKSYIAENIFTMKQIGCLCLFLIFSLSTFAQEKKLSKKEEKSLMNQLTEGDFVLKHTADTICDCIEKIDESNKNAEMTAKEISACIDSQVVAYQLMKSLLDASNSKSKGNTTIYLNPNLNSQQAKEAHYEIERYLMKNCGAMRAKTGKDNIERENSVSKNRDAKFNYERGNELFAEGNFKEAINYYKLAIKIDPKFVFAYDNLGLAYRKNNQYDEAIEAYEKSVELDSNGTMPLQNLAIAYLYKQEYAKAILTYDRLDKISPGNPEIYYGLGQIYSSYVVDYEKALDNMCKAYNIYVAQKSPYRTDAEKMINLIYAQMKKNGNQKRFNEILSKHNINTYKEK